MSYEKKYYKCPVCNAYYTWRWPLLKGHLKLKHGSDFRGATENTFAPCEITESEFKAHADSQVPQTTEMGPRAPQRIVPQLADAIIDQDWEKVKKVYRTLRNIRDIF